MQYHSTRGSSPAVDSAQAVLFGIADDGGLYLPERHTGVIGKEEKLAKRLSRISTANWEMLPLRVELQGAHILSAE